MAAFCVLKLFFKNVELYKKKQNQILKKLNNRLHQWAVSLQCEAQLA